MSLPKYVDRVEDIILVKFGGTYTVDTDTYSPTTKKIIGNCKYHGTIEFNPKSVIVRDTIPCCKCRHTITDTASFIKYAKETHGTTYDYSSTVYVSSVKPVIITCSVHGDFAQRPTDHVSGKKGCFKCGNNIPTTQDIVGRFKQVHGDKYNYDKVAYTKATTPVVVTCSVHGEFSIRPYDHIFNKQGCSGCATTGFSSVHPAYFYVLKVYSNDKIYFKIGITKKSIKHRYTSIHDKKRIRVCFMYRFNTGGYARKLESELLRAYKSFKVNEPILKSGNTEIISIDLRKTQNFKEVFNEYRHRDNVYT